MPPLETTAVASQWRADLAKSWWAFIIVPVLLTIGTTILAGPIRATSSDVAAQFGFNALASLYIGGTAIVVHGVARTMSSSRLGRIAIATLAVSVVLGAGVALLASQGTLFGYQASEFWVHGVIIAAVSTATVAAVVAVQDKLRHRLFAERLATATAKHDAATAELRALQAHLNPHFLFNALNTVVDLIETRPPQAVDAVGHLADLLRYSMSGDAELVPLGREVEAVEHYLDLQGLRFGSRLRAHVDVPAPLRSCLVPRLSLQPLVENAVTHGVATDPDGAEVTIRATVAQTPEPAVSITVANTGSGASGSGGQGSALDNLRRRLTLHYGDTAQLHAGPRDDGGFTVRFAVPDPQGRVDPS